MITACSQRFNDLSATLNTALFDADDAVLSQQDILDLPYASSFVRINDGAQIFMVLAFAEKQPKTGKMQLKWLSSDQAMIVTEDGRIIKTLGLPQVNLTYIQPAQDSLPTFSSIMDKPVSWQARYDWQTKQQYLFNYQATITPVLKNKSQLNTIISEINVTEVQEVVTIASLDASFVNRYWIDDNNHVVKTQQHLGPDMGYIEMIIIKPFAL